MLVDAPKMTHQRKQQYQRERQQAFGVVGTRWRLTRDGRHGGRTRGVVLESWDNMG